MPKWVSTRLGKRIDPDCWVYIATIGNVDVYRFHRGSHVLLQWTERRADTTLTASTGAFARSRVPQHIKDAVIALIAMEKSHA